MQSVRDGCHAAATRAPGGTGTLATMALVSNRRAARAPASMPSFAPAVAATLLSLAAVAALAEPVTIADAYEMHDVSDTDAADAMARCVGKSGLDAKAFIAMHSRPGDITRSDLSTTKDAAGAVVAAGPFWSCVPFSHAGFPVWPVEALAGAVTIRGVEPAVQADWARKVLTQVAAEGEGRGLIILNTGDGLEFKVIAEQQRASLIHYTTRKVPKDEIDRARFAAVIDDPHFAGTTTTRMGTGNDSSLPAVFALPEARLRKPVDGEYVRERADDLTARFDFTSTRWQFNAKSLDAVLELQADGHATETSKTGAQSHKTEGSWRVEGGVLHVAIGLVRFSLVLADDKTLTGDGRRKPFTGEATMDPLHAGDTDVRWTLKLTRA